jgi:competence protein ComEC
VDPEISLFSTGYRNRYRFPNEKVMQRYQQLGSQLIQTDKSGAIIIDVTGEKGIVVEKYRETAARYWHHDVGARLINHQKKAIN